MDQKLLSKLKHTVQQWIAWATLPTSEERTLFMNQRILSQLQDVGVASQDDVNHLKKRIQKLESLLVEYEKKLSSHPHPSTPKKKNKSSSLYT